MKTRPLSDIDLARIAPLPRDRQRKQLEQIRDGRPPFSYAPLRSRFHDIFNIYPEMFGPTKTTNWTKIEKHLIDDCTSDAERQANIAVALGLYNFAIETRLFGRKQEFSPLLMGSGRRVAYWIPIILSLDDQPFVPFIDPRRSRGLTQEGRRFAFSMMHERIRVADPDYAAVRFAIFRFGDKENEQRSPILYTDEGIELFSFDQMEDMIRTTYELWHEICTEREEEARRSASGRRGSLI